MSSRKHSLLIHEAVSRVGGEARLRLLLGLSWSELRGWLARIGRRAGAMLERERRAA